MILSRRQFVAGVAGTSGVLLAADSWRSAFGEPALIGPGYGPLQVPDLNGVMLPPGFSSRVVATSGQPVGPSEYLWHYEPDGGSVFAMPDGGWVYTSNSEVTIGDPYPQGYGGAGAIRFDRNGVVVDGYPILTGSDTEIITNNCAGGKTPWGTWLSCEEQAGVGRVWECRVDQAGQGVSRPLMGLFAHEACAIDPRDNRVYMTEDASGSELPNRMQWGRIYRYTPAGLPGDILQSGTLDTLVVDGDPYDGSHGPWPIGWSRPIDPASASTLGHSAGGTPFTGGEGAWFDNGVVYFTTKGDNRVWRLDLDQSTLEVIYDDADYATPTDVVLSGVDNVTVSPGGEIFVAEDGGNREICLLQPTAGGRFEVSPFMRLFDHDESEITGPAFTDDGSRLYFSSQRGRGPSGLGMTFEITGPFAVPAQTPTPTTTTAPATTTTTSSTASSSTITLAPSTTLGSTTTTSARSAAPLPLRPGPVSLAPASTPSGVALPRTGGLEMLPSGLLLAGMAGATAFLRRRSEVAHRGDDSGQGE